MEQCEMTDPREVQTFLFAGNARITLVSKRTQTRFTYRVRRPQDKGMIYFVSVLTGNDNESSYQYLGLYRRADDPQYEHGAKSKISIDAPSCRAWCFFSRNVLERQQMPDDLEVWHEGRCGRCGQTLTVPESIERGIGPECWNHVRHYA
jgi:hypothetical protein